MKDYKDELLKEILPQIKENERMIFNYIDKPSHNPILFNCAFKLAELYWQASALRTDELDKEKTENYFVLAKMIGNYSSDRRENAIVNSHNGESGHASNDFYIKANSHGKTVQKYKEQFQVLEDRIGYKPVTDIRSHEKSFEFFKDSIKSLYK